MLTCPPTLHTRRPSPTTIEYTVSTLPPLTLPLRLLLLLTHLIRLSLGFLILLTLYIHYLRYFPPPTGFEPLTPYLPSYLLPSQLLSLQPHILPLLLLPLYPLLTRPHTHESLLILRHLGLQISSSPQTYLSTTKTRFIPSTKIQDIYINEVFKGFEVRYVLVVVVEGEGELLVVFERLLPGRRVLERVWRGARGGLFGDGGGSGKEGKEGREGSG
ncbi:gpi- c transferase complex protein [Rutstroemia sp. NJR-2017a BVV2]|nr:gpi- c transferase complex protein [Rutstroemia sp. NJR-2017a BVV2]